MRKRFFDTSLITLVLLAVCQIAGSQTIIDKLIAKADSARLAYDFILADELCRQVVELDSTAIDKVEDLSIMSKNGQKMMEFCSRPVVVARRTFPLKDFTIPRLTTKVSEIYTEPLWPTRCGLLQPLSMSS